jgi:hypothetical protein
MLVPYPGWGSGRVSQKAAGATAQWGVIGGAAYRIEVPDNWNG